MCHLVVTFTVCHGKNWLWHSQFAMENHHAIKNGKPSISMGHLYRGYVSHNQRVDIVALMEISIIINLVIPIIKLPVVIWWNLIQQLFTIFMGRIGLHGGGKQFMTLIVLVPSHQSSFQARKIEPTGQTSTNYQQTRKITGDLMGMPAPKKSPAYFSISFYILILAAPLCWTFIRTCQRKCPPPTSISGELPPPVACWLWYIPHTQIVTLRLWLT